MKLTVIELPTMRPTFALLFSEVPAAFGPEEAAEFHRFGEEAGAAATLATIDKIETQYGYAAEGQSAEDLLEAMGVKAQQAPVDDAGQDFSEGPPVDDAGPLDLDDLDDAKVAALSLDDLAERARRRERGIGPSWGAPGGLDD